MQTKLLLLLLLLFTSTAFATPTTPTSDFTDNNDGTVTHKTTGLIWMRCAMGQTWTGSTCTGNAQTYTYAAATALTASFAGFSDWRLPNIAELNTLVERENISPAMNTTVFPNASASWFWSSSPNASSSNLAWIVYFNNGDGYNDFKNYGYGVRLVRGGQCILGSLVDLTTSITASTHTVQLKQNITYTATMTNNGSAAATNATLIFYFPPRWVNYVAVPSGCLSNGKSYRCSVPSLAAGASLTQAITVNYAQRGALNVVGLAITDSDDSDETNNKAQVMTTITP